MNLNFNRIALSLFAVCIIFFIYVFEFSNSYKSDISIQKIRSSGSPKALANTIKQRDEYFFKMLRDPKTNRIPKDLQETEKRFSELINIKGLRKQSSQNFVNWQEAGPNDVGGRTRALALDIRNSDIVLAGGVSGGIWKSTDNGNTWELKFNTTQRLSVTCLTQDIREGHEDTWYAGTGEYNGNSASLVGSIFRGAGLYKSIDNGETWELLMSSNNDLTRWDSSLDYVSQIAVNPITGSLFIACNGSGIYKSDDGGESGSQILGNNSRYCEIDISSTGTIVATLSENSSSSSYASVNPGVWKSHDDGTTWTDITPSSYPTGLDYRRAVAAIAPSNPNICYVIVDVNDAVGDNRLYKINIEENTSEDLSVNLPNFDVPYQNKYESQGGYDMLIAVKPDDENFVLLGGKSLYRSFDGFATPLTDAVNQWIGGYDNTDGNGNYLNSHPDMHSFAFDLKHPDTVWIGHDGGLSYTTKISALNGVDFTDVFEWENKNNKYNITQSYFVAIPKEAGDNRILVGTQDNGTPFFNFDSDGNFTSDSYDVSSGDGADCYFGETFAYVSGQNGVIIQLAYKDDGKITDLYTNYSGEHFALIFPADATGQQFITPYCVDPSDENYIYYPAGGSIWRNNSLNSISSNSGYDFSTGEFVGILYGWSKLENLEAPQSYIYTALDVSDSHVLYCAASSYNGIPKIYRLDNSDVSNDAAVDISISDMTAGANINDIAINPLNSNEILVVASNYHIVGLYHSLDGGSTYTAIEGNLRGEDDKGPSLRTAKILPIRNSTIYFVGTSVGLFSTNNLDGENTVWEQEGGNAFGNVVVTSIDFRTSDNYVAVGTHGRGVFTGTINPAVGIKQIEKIPASYSLSQNYPNPFNPSTKIRYSVPLASNVSLKIYDINGQEVTELINEYQPAGTFEANWNGTNSFGRKVASGVYIYTLRAGDFVQTKKMVMLK